MRLFLIQTLWRHFSRRRTKTIEFRFALPGPKPGVRLPALHGDAYAKELASMAGTPLDQIRFLHRSMKELNSCKLKSQKRLEAGRRILFLFFPLLQQEMQKYSINAGVPDPAIRKNTLDACADVLFSVAQSYMAIFKDYYEKPDAQFSHQIDLIRQVACRILELFRLEQRVVGLRYKELKRERWYYINSVFHIMRAYGEVESDLPVLESDIYPGHAGRVTSISRVFLALNMTGRLDMLQWPVHLQTVFVGYLESQLENTAIMEGQNAELDKTRLISWCGSSTFASSQRSSRCDNQNSVVIDYREMDRRMRRDCDQILHAHENSASAHGPKKLQSLSGLERLAMSHLLIRSLDVGFIDPSRQREEPILGMQMYVTFKDVYHYIFHILSGKVHSQGKRLEDHFAERSAVIAEDHTTEHRSLWFVLLHNHRMIRLKTQETDFTTQLEIGSLVAYELGEQDKYRPRLASVKRLYRPDDASVIIDMDRLAKYAEPVSIEVIEPMPANPEKIGALLIHDPDIGWNLLFSSNKTISEACAVRMLFRNYPIEFKVGKLKQATTGFYLFDVPLDLAQLGLDEPPVFPMPRSGEAAS